KEDELVKAQLTDGNQIIFLASHEGLAIRFEEEDVRPMGRPAYGVRGMDLDKGDYIVGMAVTPKDEAAEKAEDKEADSKADSKAKASKKAAKEEAEAEPEKPAARLILSVTEHGYGKRTHVDEYRLQSRGGKGVINVKTAERNGKVSAIMLVN